MAGNKRRARRPKASSWDKVSARLDDQQLATRDVYNDQQLDRGERMRLRSNRPGLILAGIAGALVTLAVWLIYSLIATAVLALSTTLSTGMDSSSGDSTPSSYYVTETTSGEGGKVIECYRPVTESGSPDAISTCYRDLEDVPVPDWYDQTTQSQPQDDAGSQEETGSSTTMSTSVGAQLSKVSFLKLFLSLGSGALVMIVISTWTGRQVAKHNAKVDHSDINDHRNDQHIALPEEIQRKFNWFPDTGAHSSVEANSLISHMMLKKKGLGTIEVAQRAEQDIIDQEGQLLYYAGEIMDDDEGLIKTKVLPMIDEDFGDALFEASGVPDNKGLRRRWDATAIPYNLGGKDRSKIGTVKADKKGKPPAGKTELATVADLVNDDWEFPTYEVQRPAGAYIVDSAPVNTMVLAITRAGKGQTYIEPALDVWSREKKPSNMVINDPKGELLVKNYVPLVTRGFEPVQFNLINSMKTDIYNPLGLAAEAAREGDSTKCALYVENIANVFFPLDGGEDPVWPNAANNAFKRAAYGLIDFYLEEERELREVAAAGDMDPETLEQKLDDLWGKVTLYNCYQLFVQLTSKKLKNPEAELEKKVKAGEFENREDELAVEQEKAADQAFLWEGKAEQDMLTLYFNATETLPTNTMRTLIGNANNALRAMAGAEKMLASVYGIAITAMSFFTDPTISALTSGKPSQNTDLAGLSFPRRLGVRFSQNYLKRDHLIGLQAKWEAYSDPMFTQSLGKDFEHAEIINRVGWARYNFKGIFPSDQAWLKLSLVNPQTNMLVRTFFFHFKKGYQLSLNGRHFITEPVTGQKLVKNGVLRELLPVREEGTLDGTILEYKHGDTTFPQDKLDLRGAGVPEKVTEPTRAIMQTMVRYSERPKAVFLVTPPHLMKYAKLILILVKQLFDVSADQAYMTKADQKPLYRTRYMLDELGNLQSEGKGIDGFETMLSIGLGQEQQFTLILQTLQQLRDVYGESVDKIVQGNAAPLDSLISTPSGWQRMGDTEAGDVILTPFGSRTTITGVFPKGTRPVYRVTLRDGSSSEVCEQHLWQVERWKSAIRYLGGKDENGRRRYEGTRADGKTAQRFVEVVDTLALKAQVDAGKQIDLPRMEPLAYDEQDLPVDPYVLGVILGDGHVQPNGVVKLTCADPEIVGEIRRRGYIVVDDMVRGERKDGIGYRINGVNAALRELGVAGMRSWEKSIPQMYRFGSVQQRTGLLRGLMDSDGTISVKGEMEFTSASRELAEGVQSLIRSLGGRVGINIKNKVIYTAPNQIEPKAGRTAYRVQNVRLMSLNPFLLSRKAERFRFRDDHSGNRVVSVEYVRDEPVQCISVADERHLYVMDDYMPTHNTSNIVFLKSTDDSMIETLEKMSGTHHVSRTGSKQITENLDKVVGGKTDSAISRTTSTEKEPLITYNDMAFIAPNQNIIFRAGDAPMWNRNETIFPMSWRLFQNKITHPGHEYSLQTIPTLSSAIDFDVRTNQPDFVAMLNKRMRQAIRAGDAKTQYQEIYAYKDVDIERLDPDVYSEEVMELITMLTRVEEGYDPNAPVVVDPEAYASTMMFSDDQFLENTEVATEVAEREATQTVRQKKVYAEGMISREMLTNPDGSAKLKSLDFEIGEAYKSVQRHLERDHEHFSVGGGGELRSADGARTYISQIRSDAYTEAVQRINGHMQNSGARVFGEEDVTEEDLLSLVTVKVHAAFYTYLASLPDWDELAAGRFDRAMAVEMKSK